MHATNIVSRVWETTVKWRLKEVEDGRAGFSNTLQQHQQQQQQQQSKRVTTVGAKGQFPSPQTILESQLDKQTAIEKAYSSSPDPCFSREMNAMMKSNERCQVM
jgi:hypothetical protein